MFRFSVVLVLLPDIIVPLLESNHINQTWFFNELCAEHSSKSLILYIVPYKIMFIVVIVTIKNNNIFFFIFLVICKPQPQASGPD